MGLLRTILAIAVVIAHSESFFGFRFTGGLVSVQIFFIISGFYMSMILSKTYLGKGSYSLFLSNRFLRLYPMFWVMLIITLLTCIATSILFDNWLLLSTYAEHSDSLKLETLLFQIVANIAILGQDLTLFLGFDTGNGAMYLTRNFRNSDPMFHKFLLVPQAWSLGLEIMFYIIAPFIATRNIKFILLIITFILLIRIYAYNHLGYDYDPWTYRFFPFELALFLFGAVSYKLYDVYRVHKISVFGTCPLNIICALMFASVIFYQSIPDLGSIHTKNWLLYGFFLLSIPFLFERSKSSTLDAKIGALSYPIYISHYLIVSCLEPVLSSLKLQFSLGELSVLCSILLSCALVRLVADPIEKIRRERVQNLHLTPAAT